MTRALDRVFAGIQLTLVLDYASLARAQLLLGHQARSEAQVLYFLADSK